MKAPSRPRWWLPQIGNKKAARADECGTLGSGNPAGSSVMSLRALLYRRPSEPQSIQIIFDQAIYPVRIRRHRQARRYTLRIHAATREVILTMPPRGSVRE